MNLYSPGKCLKIICVTLLVSSLSFFCVCILPFADPWIEQCATAANQGDRTVPDADGADFTQSVMLGPDHRIPEGETIDYQIILRNTGSKRPDHMELRIPVDSTSALLASAPELSYNLEDRILRWRGMIGPGEEERFTVRLVTIPKSFRTWVFTRALIDWGSGDKGFVVQTEIGPELRPSRFILPGGIGIEWTEVIILGYLLFVLFFWIIGRRKIRSPDEGIITYVMSGMFLATLAVLLFLSGIVIEDIRMFVSYEKTTCTILDKNTKVLGNPGFFGRNVTPKYYLAPLVAVRFIAGGKEILAAGSLAKSSLFLSHKSAIRRLAQYDLGKSYPCWFDPEHPRMFILKRSLSWTYYLIGIVPLFVFLISCRYLIKNFIGRKASTEGLPPPPIR